MSQSDKGGAAEAPHVPAAFINAIAEEGTRAEALEWLQKTWNERCQLAARIEELKRDRDRALRIAYERTPDCQTVEEAVQGLVDILKRREVVSAPSATQAIPDGYAVVLDDKNAPAGRWFVGIWTTEEAAKAVVARSPRVNGERVEPMAFLKNTAAQGRAGEAALGQQTQARDGATPSPASAVPATQRTLEPDGFRSEFNACMFRGYCHGLAPVSSTQDIDVDWLANVIRTAHGDHSKLMGAGALAEKIVEAISARSATQPSKEKP